LNQDLTAQKFGRLTAQWPSGIDRKQVIWLCSCACGSLSYPRSYALRTGTTKSCGCLQRERVRECTSKRNTKHGNAFRGDETVEYRTWASMIQRCINPTVRGWKYYGGRGISVCSRWLKFENFLADMGVRPSALLSLDRINNDGNYEPSNCRWATRSEQRLNQRPRKN